MLSLMSSAPEFWIAALESALGRDRVLTDADRLPSFAGDESGVGPVLPSAVARVRSASEVGEAVRVAAEHGVPITARGGGTGKAGGCVPSAGGLVIDLSPMKRVNAIDKTSMVAEIEPGVVTGDFRRLVAEEGFLYPPDPNSLATCTVGGNVATNAGGPSSMKYGVTREYVLGLDLVVAGGDLIRLGRRTLKGVAGYDLTALVVGSEGTLGVVTSITLRLRPLPRAVRTLLTYFRATADAASAVAHLAASGVDLRAAEFIDTLSLEAARAKGGFDVPADAGAVLLIELDAEREDGSIDAVMEAVGELLLAHGAADTSVAASESQREAIWSVRRDLSASIKEGRRFSISEDVGVPRANVPELVARVEKIRDRSRIDMSTYGHAGEGNLHVNLLWDEPGDRDRAVRASEEVFRAALDLGGTISGEHGLGIAKRRFLPWEQSDPVIALQRELKRVFDPSGIMNPGKLLP